MKLSALWLYACLFNSVAGHAQTSRFWRLEERSVLTDFSVVRALAGDQTQLFIATDLGLLRYDHAFGRWEPPLSYLDGYPARSVTVALADPSDGSVWLGTTTGLVHYSYRTRQIDSIPLPGGVLNLMFDADQPFRGLFVRTRRGWELLPRGAFTTTTAARAPTRRLVPSSIDDVLRRYPTLDASRASLLVDERLRQSRYTSAFPLPNTERIAIGTDGMGAFIFDPLGDRFEALQYGLVGVGAGAVIVSSDGVWTGSYGGGRRNGFTRVDEDLSRFESFEGPRARGYGFSLVRDLLRLGDELWAATETGLLITGTDGQMTVVDRDLPDRSVLSLLEDGRRVWVGTARGLAYVDRDLNVSSELGASGFQVFGLAAIGDSIWLATSAGVGAIARSGGRVGVPLMLLDVPGLTDPVTDVVALGDTLVVATLDRKIMWHADGGWQTDTRAQAVGVILTLEADRGGVWIGGEQGVAFLRLSDRHFVSFTAPADVPGPVRDIAVSTDYVWLATDGGLVRFTRSALQ